MTVEIDDVEDALRRADELAELTGRTKKDVVADLLDDGQLNYSAGEDATEVKDILDVAQEKAEKLKSLIITMIPVIALVLGGGGLEMLGVTSWTDGESDDGDWSPPPVRWGCMDPNADNFDDTAQEDDGSCEHTDPPDSERGLDIRDAHISLVGDNELKVEFNLFVEGDFCCDDIELIWEIEVNGMYDDGLRRVTHHSYDEEGLIHSEEYWPDMPDGNYHARVEVQWMNEMWDEETTNGVVIEPEEEDEEEPQSEPITCDQDLGNVSFVFYDKSVTWTNNNTTVQFRWDADSDCDEPIPIEVDITLSRNGTPVEFKFASYNLTGDEMDYRVVTLAFNRTNETWEGALAIWIDIPGEGWKKVAECEAEVS